jgi:hypothetical protein
MNNESASMETKPIAAKTVSAIATILSHTQMQPMIAQKYRIRFDNFLQPLLNMRRLRLPTARSDAIGTSFRSSSLYYTRAYIDQRVCLNIPSRMASLDPKVEQLHAAKRRRAQNFQAVWQYQSLNRSKQPISMI